MQEMIRFIGLDVHKEFISVAIADEGRGEVVSYGEIVNTAAAISKLAKKLSRDGCELCFVYEAGCFGFVICRQLNKLGHSCVVAAPSLMPRKPGDRVKTDTRDALKLARLLRSGDITPCHVHDEADEAMRDLVRAREDAVCAYRVSRQRLNGFLLRHGKVYGGKSRRGPVVDALQALRGVCLITAVTIVAEMGDLRRFAHPQQLMAAIE